MGYHVRKPQGFRTPQFEHERIDRFPPQFLARRREVDKVRIMGNSVVDPLVGQGGQELLGFFDRNFAGAPLIAVLRKKLEALATGLPRPVDRLFVAPRN
jgi:hypothetical protein